MAHIRSQLVIEAPAEAVWALITDWPAQSRWVPLTTVTVEYHGPHGAGIGTRFTGRTRLGPITFDDPMEVTEWQPPVGGVGRCRVRKLGPWLTGWAEIEVRPVPGGTSVRWTEQVRARWTPRIADPVISRVGSMFFSRVLRKMGAEFAAPSPE
jgi:uncharacterized protein YndB with AHSA1/START domain